MDDYTQDSLDFNVPVADTGAYYLQPGALQESFDLDGLKEVAPARVRTFFDHLDGGSSQQGK